MKVFYALLVLFLVNVSLQEQYDSLRSKPYSPCQDASFIPYPGDCTLYLRCSCGKCETYKCMPGFHWNSNKNICDWPDIAKCSFIKLDEDKIISAGTRRLSLSPLLRTPSATTIATSATTTLKPDIEMTVEPVYDGTGYKVICYFINSAWERPGDGKYLPSDIDETLCTHINYAYAVLDASTWTIKPDDSKADIDNEFFKKVTALRAKGIKVLITLSGLNDSGRDKYSRLVNNPSAREKFITNVMQFIDKHNFDGLDIDWRYPKCWQTVCSEGPDSDKEGSTALVRELSAAFKPKGLLLSAIVSPLFNIIDAAYEVPQLSKYLDWINVMTYDYYGYWNQHTGHIAPLYSISGANNHNRNVDSSINYWIDEGADPQKIIMGMPLYGQSFTLTDASSNTLFSLTKSPGKKGEFTRAKGNLAFYEICDRVKNRGWTSVYNNKDGVGPYAYKENQWVSYDDVGQIVRKAKFIKELHLGGGMIWALDLDDFRNRCGCGKHPLLKAMNHELRGIKIDTKLTDCT